MVVALVLIVLLLMYISVVITIGSIFIYKSVKAFNESMRSQQSNDNHFRYLIDDESAALLNTLNIPISTFEDYITRRLMIFYDNMDEDGNLDIDDLLDDLNDLGNELKLPQSELIKLDKQIKQFLGIK